VNSNFKSFLWAFLHPLYLRFLQMKTSTITQVNGSIRPTIKTLYCLKSELYLTYSIEQSSSWEANWFSASQEIPRILWKPKVHYRIHKCPPPVPILRLIDAVHYPTFHFLKSHLNIILPSKPGSSKWSLFFRFPHQQPVYTAPLPVRVTCPAHLILLDWDLYLLT